MSPIKIAFFDIDGTLVDMNRKVISTKMIQTLQSLKENGIKICIATGRAPMTLPHFPGIDFDAFLTFNASYCFTKDHVIVNNMICASDVRKIISNAAAIHRPVSIATKDRIAANGTDKDLVDYFSFAKLTIEVAADFEELLQGDIYQIMMGCTKEEYDDVLKNVSGAKITAWWDRAVDIIPANGGKGQGIKKVLEYYHLTPQQAIAFGDGANDIDMLQTVGTGIAMLNGTPDVQAAADDICDSVANDGIYYYCKKHGLI